MAFLVLFDYLGIHNFTRKYSMKMLTIFHGRKFNIAEDITKPVPISQILNAKKPKNSMPIQKKLKNPGGSNPENQKTQKSQKKTQNQRKLKNPKNIPKTKVNPKNQYIPNLSLYTRVCL
jgi:hypothetical protein